MRAMNARDRVVGGGTTVASFGREVWTKWVRDAGPSRGAALAYYTIFSLAPLLVLLIAIVGLVLGRSTVQGQIFGQIEGLVGPDAARTLEGMIVQISRPASGIIATVLSLGTMLLGASGVLGELQAALNQIFRAPERKGGLRDAVRQRLAAFGLVLAIGGILFGSMLLTTALTATHELVQAHMPVLAALLGPLNFALSLAITGALFAAVFRLLPAVKTPWLEAWLGGIATALLFTLGKTLIGIYLGRSGRTSVYGAAGSLVLLLLWVYYSAQILLLGAEVTSVWAFRRAAAREAARPAGGVQARSG